MGSHSDDDDPGDAAPKSLMLCMGWEPVQWRVVCQLRHDVGLHIEACMVLTHRQHRDLILAAAAAEFTKVRGKPLLVCNAPIGPWQSSANWKDITGTVNDLHVIAKPNNKVLLYFWP